MADTKDGFLLDDEPLEKEMDEEEVLHYLEKSEDDINNANKRTNDRSHRNQGTG